MLSIYFVLFFSHSSDLFYCLSPLTKATALSRLLAAFREHSYCAQLFLFFFFFAKLSAAGKRIIFMHLRVNIFSRQYKVHL